MFPFAFYTPPYPMGEKPQNAKKAVVSPIARIGRFRMESASIFGRQ